jgi:glycosyltransferase involved in cell wall biosynthesis
LSELAKSPPDVFVPNLVVAGYYAARWVSRAGIPTVGILHSDDPFYDALRERFAAGSKRLRLSALVCVSRELEEQSRSLVPASVEVRRIPYGVPVPRTPRRRDTSGLRLAYVGRLAEEQKRITEQTRALCRVVREIPGTEAVLYGDGPDRRRMEAVLADEGKGLPVRWGGLIESRHMQEILLGFDVLVLLSDYEGLPIAVLEAMACGVVPVCLRMRSGIPELVEDGVSGIIVEDRGGTFTSAIQRLHDNPTLWATLSNNARLKIESGYSMAHCANEWAAFLRERAQQNKKTNPIAIPRSIFLPTVHPALAGADPRPAPFSARIRHALIRSRMFAGKLKRAFRR